MFDITLITMGKLKEKFYISAASEYAKRLGGYCKFTLLELPETRLPEDPSPSEISAGLEKEAELIFSKIPKGAWFCVFTPEGKELSSEAFAEKLRDVKNAEISVNGTAAQSISSDHVVIPVNGAQTTVIELKNCQHAVNAPVADRIADLLTRVQGSNIWKAANFPTAQNPDRAKKLPKDIRLALEEFGSLLD